MNNGWSESAAAWIAAMGEHGDWDAGLIKRL